MDDRDAQRRTALGAFLRSRRERLAPHEVGLDGWAVLAQFRASADRKAAALDAFFAITFGTLLAP